MGLFARRPPKPEVVGAEPPAALEVIRRIKVTIDRYWVTSERRMDANLDRPVEPTSEVKDVDGEGG